MGGNGTILKTTSGGDSWTQITSSVGNNLKKVLFIDNQKGFIGGNKVLLKTTDGGLNWQATSIAFEINELLFFNSNSGIATTSEGITPSMEDGGVTWVESDINHDGMLGKAAFDGETGYVVGYEGIFNKFILKTTDGGKVWERQFPDAQNNLAGMTIAPEGKVWTGGLNGKLFSTTDAGGSSYPVASFKGYTAICENQGYTFTNNGPENKYTYEWRVDGALKSTSYDFTTAFTPGNHTVELKAIDGAISGVTQQSFNVEPSANFTRALIVEVANGLCEGSGTVFTTKDPEYGLYRLYKGTELVAEDNDYSDGVRLPVPPLQSTTTFRFTASRQNSCE